MKIRVGVIFGGCSVEHEVSIISALQAIKNIDREKYEVVPIYISKDRLWYTHPSLLEISNYKNLDNVTRKSMNVVLCKMNNEFVLMSTKGILKKVVDKIDVAFPIVHGQNVEDGTLAGYLDTVGIPYVGPNVMGASLGQDKVILKQVLQNEGIPVVPYIWFYDEDYLNDKEKYLKKVEELGYPVVVKPACLGSSVGINFVKNDKLIEDAINEALEYDKKIIIEKAVSNLVEVNCSALGNYKNVSVSAIEQVRSDNSILTYEDKYIGDKKGSKSQGMVNTKRIIPAPIGEELTKKIQSTTKDVFKILNLSGVCRIDYLIDNKTKEYFVNEPNTIPGSLAFYLWEETSKKSPFRRP